MRESDRVRLGSPSIDWIGLIARPPARPPGTTVGWTLTFLVLFVYLLSCRSCWAKGTFDCFPPSRGLGFFSLSFHRRIRIRFLSDF